MILKLILNFLFLNYINYFIITLHLKFINIDNIKLYLKAYIILFLYNPF